MHIGVAGPATLEMLAGHLPPGTALPPGYPFPLIAQYVDALLARGHRVTLFTLCKATRRPLFLAGDRLAVSVTPWRPRRAWLDLLRREVRGLAAAMAAHPTDVLHACWTYEFARAALHTGIPTLVTAHDSPFTILRLMWPGSGRYLRLARTWHALRVIPRARRLTAVSPYLAEELRRDFRIRGRLTVVPNGLDEADFVPAARPARAPGWAPVVLASFSGEFEGRKNGPVLLDACRRLAEAGRAFRLVLVGAGCEPGGRAERLMEAAGCRFPARLLGPMAHGAFLDLLEREADLLVLPSREESFGMVALEAMAKGVPVVAGDRSGALPWLLGDGACGFLADVGSGAALAEVLDQALADPARCAARAARAWARARAEFSLGTMTDRYLALLAEAAAEG